MTLYDLMVWAVSAYAIWHVLYSDAGPLTKLGWSVGIVLIPVFGFLMWAIAGPRSSVVRIRRRPTAPGAPAPRFPLIHQDDHDNRT
ncbi:MAG: PLD nuclease N-terminal domain-containing protein [Pseudomonadota bacterium]